MEDYKSVTQISLSEEQRKYIENITNFSGAVCNYITDNYETLKKLEFQEHKGQKVAKFVSNKSISIPVSLRHKLKEDNLNLSNIVRFVIDNKYI